MKKNTSKRPLALITGVSRTIGIGATIAHTLAKSGWDIALTYWQAYDKAKKWGSNPKDLDVIISSIKQTGAKVIAIEADLADSDAPKKIFETVEHELGTVTSLIINHCHCVKSDILSTTVESFDLHFAINTRSTWLLIREYVNRFDSEPGSGRIIAITSDHTAGNLPYGASKGAMDRIVLASAKEFKKLGITANVIDPGGTDTGWMSDEIKTEVRESTLLNRIGLPSDCANLVSFLCSKEGGWINSQTLYSDGGVF